MGSALIFSIITLISIFDLCCIVVLGDWLAAWSLPIEIPNWVVLISLIDFSFWTPWLIWFAITKKWKDPLK